MMIRPDELSGIKKGTIDLAFRRWDRARVKVGTRMRTAVGLIEVTELSPIAASLLRAADARRSGAASLSALRTALSARPDRMVFRIGLRYAGADPREELREKIPDHAEVTAIHTWLDRLDNASPIGPWTRATLEIVDRCPGVRAPDLAAELGRVTAEFKTDVRKLKEKGLTESLAIGYHLSPRGTAVLDAQYPNRAPQERKPASEGTPLPRTIGAPATRALRAADVTTLEAVVRWTADELLALHGFGPIALARIRERAAELNLTGPLTDV